MAKDSGSPALKAKIRRLKKLARATAELSLEVFGDIVNRNPGGPSPKPKRRGGTVLLASSAPVPNPPKPKFESLADIAHGALTIEESLPGLDPEE